MPVGESVMTWHEVRGSYHRLEWRESLEARQACLLPLAVKSSQLSWLSEQEGWWGPRGQLSEEFEPSASCSLRRVSDPRREGMRTAPWRPYEL